MEARHDLTVDHARLSGFAGLDSSGHPTSQQLRPPYGDLCRPPGADASTLAAYHRSYMASMPLAAGSTFPFLGGMFAGTLPGPPTSPFRAPSTPGMNNRFWPPTPPPEGYGRYSMNTSLFPLFGAPTPDGGAFLSQGLVGRLGTATHLSPVLDPKDHGFFTHGIGLGSPLTPTSHVTSPSPFPHLIPSLERHPFIGHMALSGKELEDPDDVRLMKNHMDCLMKQQQDMTTARKASKIDGKICEKSDDCCKPSKDRQGEGNRTGSRMDAKNHNHHPTNKVQPCKIEVSVSPTLKLDILSPPIDSPKQEAVSSPARNGKKTTPSPVPAAASPGILAAPQHRGTASETRCSQCCASMKGTVVATKIAAGDASDPATGESAALKSCAVLTTESTPSNRTVSEISDVKQINKPAGTPVNDYTNKTDPPKTKSTEIIPSKSPNVHPPTPVKHVTAAVIPTAPKQTVFRESSQDNSKATALPDVSRDVPNCETTPEFRPTPSDNPDVKLEANDSSVPSEKAFLMISSQQSSGSVFSPLPQRSVNKNLSTSCKVKDMIRGAPLMRQSPGEKLQATSPNKGYVVDNGQKPTLSASPPQSAPSSMIPISPTNLSKNPTGKAVLPPPDRISPVMKAEAIAQRQDCEFSQKSMATNWSKATVVPFNWQNNNSSADHDDQAINLTVSKKPVKPEPSESNLVQNRDAVLTPKLSTEVSTTTTTSSMVGVCLPNPSPVAVNKVKGTPAMSSISNFSSISVLNQPSEQSTEVHILHRSSKSSFPIVNRNVTPPVPMKSTISHVTANTSIHRSIKSERLTSKRGKLGDSDKLGHTGRSPLATLAPKLTKPIGFGKDTQASHTLSASSSVSSTSIVFPATVNPCIPVGIAIAQQRQDSSTNGTAGKSQSSLPTTTPNVMTPNQHLANSRVAADLQAQEILTDQKNQDLSCSNNPTPVDANLLVTQGPTIVSRQWETEALTRTAMPSASWLTHGSVVAPAVWLGQGAYAAASPSTAVPGIAMNALEPSPLSLPPGGYQLARDSLSGHLLLIPNLPANLELMDRTSVWPSFNTSAGNLPIQQLVTQQQHTTQFEQVLPHAETLKTEAVDACNITACDISAQSRQEDKVEDLGGQVPSVPLAAGQTYAFTTFPTQCDPSSFSYVLQSQTVMHLAHTQTAPSIQPDSERRSQGTSPLHCATPSPPPNTCSVQVSITEDEESDSDVACAESTLVQSSSQNQSVTTAIQVDMDTQTNSEEDEEEEHKTLPDTKPDEPRVEMLDFAIQTESVSPKSEPEVYDSSSLVSPPPPPCDTIDTDAIPSISIKEEVATSEPRLEIVTSETELAPSLPVESQPVMDFIDHHGLNLLVDSIEEFASRGHEDFTLEDTTTIPIPNAAHLPIEPVLEDQPPAVIEHTSAPEEPQYPFKPMEPYTDGLGLLCALATQQIHLGELSRNECGSSSVPRPAEPSAAEVPKPNSNVVREQSVSDDSVLSSCSSQDYEETSELDMRARLAELQKKYRQKQRELEMLRSKREKDTSDDSECRSNSPMPSSSNGTSKMPLKKSSPSFRDQSLFGRCVYKPWQKKKRKGNDSFVRDTGVSGISKGIKKSKIVINKKKEEDHSSDQRVHAKVPSITLVHETSASISGDSNASSAFSGETGGLESKKSNKIRNYNNENSSESMSTMSKDDGSSQDQEYEKMDKSKAPVFDEQAWFVRRSERIFLSDARTVPSAASEKGEKSAKKSSSSTPQVPHKDKKEPLKTVKLAKCVEDSENKKVRKRRRKKLILSKKLCLTDSSDSGSNDDGSGSEGEQSDGASSTSENLPLSELVESSGGKTSSDRPKRLSVDSVLSEASSGQSEDIPLSKLVNPKNSDVPELKSCILQPDELQENARLLVLDEGLFYAGNVTKGEDPDVYGILIDGDRAARPHMFSKEEILNAAVLEVKPTHREQLPEGSRICAFWSQQYRCLYPGTVTKASSPMPDPSMLYVEFDDGDSGRIPLNDIRMLPTDFPIVSMEPNPFMILGKRRSRAQSQNSEPKNGNESTGERERSESRKRKDEKSVKKVHSDAKAKETVKRKRSPSASNRSRSSSCASRTESKGRTKKEPEEEPKRKKHQEDKLSSPPDSKPKKHKRHKEDHRKHHHHHHHKHHHHKKRKGEKHERRSSGESVSSSCSSSSSGGSPTGVRDQDTFVLENSKSELTVTIKKSPSPHTGQEEAERRRASSDSSESEDEGTKKKTKTSKQANQNKPAKRKERVPSVEKSKIAAFLPVRQLWRWSGTSFRRPGARGKAKKEFYRAIQRGKETIKVGDCAVFLSTGRPHLPYIGRIETMWKSWGGKMDVKVKWFYHPEETKSGKKLSQLKGALFQSPHFDENDVQTISHKCEVLSWEEYQRKRHPENKYGSLCDNNDTYFLAGTYDPILGTLILEPGVPAVPSSNTTQ